MAEALLFLSLALALVSTFLFFFCISLLQKLSSLQSSKKSLSTKYGQLTEQFIPFVKNLPFNPKNFRFLGEPIDGIAFEDSKIIFAEFKVGSSKLSEKQNNIKNLVLNKKVEWFEHRME
jgi:predicted Holliday junction resolvase-like endonuclease